MKYYSEVLDHLFDSESECKAAEAQYADAKKAKEAAAKQQDEQMQKLIYTYENKHKALTEQYNATLNLAKELVNQQDALERQQKALEKRRVCLNEDLRNIARNMKAVEEKLEELKAPKKREDRMKTSDMNEREFEELMSALFEAYNHFLG